MKKLLLTAIFIATTFGAFAQLTVTEHTLSNGMKVWLNEDHSSGKVFGAVVVNAGAVDCPKTGIAHYFEHIAFKGTDKIGTIDFAKEKIYLDSIETLYNELSQTKDGAARKGIQRHINALTVESAKYVIPNEFDNLISKYGGTDLNAYTSSDRTVYHNSFSAQYIAQWCEINSERLLNPVFRLFQSELETIYEEKNMYDDYLGSIALEKLEEAYYAPNENAYTVLGTTENLKNPNMKAMRDYYNRFYVANNMSLVLCGDFDSDSVLPILETTFGRIQSGEANPRKYTPAAEFKGRQDVGIKVNIPIIRARAYGWRGLDVSNADVQAMDVATEILTNSSSTGYYDKFVNDGKLMAVMAFNSNTSNNGQLAVAVIPNIIGGSMKDVDKIVFSQIERLKNGDIDTALLASIKLVNARGYMEQLETLEGRADVMVNLLASNRKWGDYFTNIDKIKALTPEDIAGVAKKYFTDNYLCATKVGGDYEKDKLEKPGFAAIKPHNRTAKSTYAVQMEKMGTLNREPKFLDFGALDSLKLAPMATLYHTPNTVNELFSVKIIFNIGKQDNNKLKALESYLDLVGSKNVPFDDFSKRMQALGSKIYFTANNYSFTVDVSGFDANFAPTMTLVADLLNDVEINDDKCKKVVEDYTMESKSFAKSSSDIAAALYCKVAYGDKQSLYMTDLTVGDVRKLKGADYAAVLGDVKRTQCEVLYCGTKPISEVASTISPMYDFAQSSIPHKSTHYLSPVVYEKPTLFFVDMPSSRQAIVYGYLPTSAVSGAKEALLANIAGQYIGGGMTSVLFQEIREFRSLAYSASGFITAPSPAAGKVNGRLTSYMSTQNDKLPEAIATVDSILRGVQFNETKLDVVKNDIVNGIYNDFPDMRDIAGGIVLDRKIGYSEDPNIFVNSNLQKVSTGDIQSFYDTKVKSGNIVYMIVGNGKNIDFKALEKYGKVVKYKPADLRSR